MKHASLVFPDLHEVDYVFASYRLRPDGTLMRGGEQIHLPPKELAALRLLLEHAGQIVSPQLLKSTLWGEVHVTPESVPRCISSLRNALVPEECIQTVYKKGYRLSAPVRVEPAWQPDGTPRLAVLPFAGGMMVADHLGAAVAEETLVRLCRDYVGRTAPFTLVARDSVFTLARQGMSAADVGRTLHADLVLTGTIRAQMSGYRLRAEVIRVRDESQLWVEDFQTLQSHPAGLERALAERLALRLGMVFRPNEINLAASADVPGTPNRIEAWERFQLGHQYLYSTQRPQLQDGLQNLLRATELDPSLIAAQIDLVHLCLKESLYGLLSPAVAAEQARRAARAIPRSDPATIAVLPAIGWLRFHIDRNLSGAVRAFEESAHLPHDPWITRWRIAFALSRCHWHQAEQLLQAALRRDPYSSWLHASLAWCWHLARQKEKSLLQMERTLNAFELDECLGLYGATILAYNGRARDALAVSERLEQSSPNLDLCTSVRAYALACDGQREEAASAIDRLQWVSRERYVSTTFIPAVYAALGDSEGALAELRSAEESRCPWFFQALADPRLDPIRNHPEFIRMQSSLVSMETSAYRERTFQEEGDIRAFG